MESGDVLRGRTGGETARHQEGGGGVQGWRTRETARHQVGDGDAQGGLTTGEAGRHPEDADVLRGRTRGETARNSEAMGHGLLSLMVARDFIGHVLFHQPPPRENPPLPTHPASELSTLNSYAEACDIRPSGGRRWTRNIMYWLTRGRLERRSNQRGSTSSRRKGCLPGSPTSR